jgi:predicted dehydrogenase
MKDSWPISAKGSGGREYPKNYIDQNFDTYSVEYTFGDGAKLFLEGRTMSGCSQEFASYAHGTKGSAIISSNSHSPARCRIFKSQNLNTRDNNPDLVWKFPPQEPNPYQTEWEDLTQAIRENKPYNEVKRGAEASLVTSMGRMAAHTGRVITYDAILNSKHEFAPSVDLLAMNSPAPVRADAEGKYPLPQPGIKTNREY